MAKAAATAQRSARAVRRGSRLETFGRIGYVAKGVVYAVVGVLAVQTAIGAGGATTDASGALREIAQQPFGQWLLALVALGLLCYGIWRILMAVRDPERRGTDAKGIVIRVGYGVAGLANIAIALAATNILAGAGGRGGDSEQAMTAQLLAQPFGRWLVGIIGAIVIIVGLVQFYRAWTAEFMQEYALSQMRASAVTWARRVGRLGLSARGITFALIGWFLIRAALQYDSSEAGGLGKALATLAAQPYGTWLLGMVAVGFVCYGLYCFSHARFRRFRQA